MMEEPKEISVTLPETVESSENSIMQCETTLPEVKGKRHYRSLERKDERTILKGLKEFRPLYLIARDLGVCRQTLYTYLREKMNICYKDMRESLIDVAEAKLLKNIMDGNQNAIQFFLDRQARHRGYGEKQIADRNDIPVINIGRIEVMNADNPKQEVIEVKQ